MAFSHYRFVGGFVARKMHDALYNNSSAVHVQRGRAIAQRTFWGEKYKNDRTLFRTVPPPFSFVLYESREVHRARGPDVTINAVAVVICVPKRILPRFSSFVSSPYAPTRVARIWEIYCDSSVVDGRTTLEKCADIFRVAKNDFFFFF